ncbi:MAG: hypothetical protein ACK5MJ_07015 [Alphaproteobacteria bacterium]
MADNIKNNANPSKSTDDKKVKEAKDKVESDVIKKDQKDPKSSINDPKPSIKEEKKPVKVESSKDKKQPPQPIKNEQKLPKDEPKVVKDEPKPPKNELKPQKSGQKKSISGFLWPVVCSVATAGGLVGTQSLWMKDVASIDNPQVSSETVQMVETNKTAIAQLAAQSGEITNLKSQIDALTAKLQEKTEAAAVVVDTPETATTVAEGAEDTTEVPAKEVTETVAEATEVITDTREIMDAKVTETVDDATKIVDTATTKTVDNGVDDAVETAGIPEDVLSAEPAVVQSQATAALEAKIAELSKEIAVLKEQQPQFEGFEGRVSQVETQLGTLSSSVSDLQSGISSNNTDMAKLVALDNIARQIDLGQDYSQSLDNLASELPEEASGAVATLQQSTKKLAPLYKLQANFNDISRDIIIAQRKEKAAQSGDKKQGLLSSLNDLVTVSRTDGGTEGSADRLVYNIKQALRSGDLNAVNQLLSSASPEVQKVVAPWQEQLKAKLDAEAALSEIRQHLSGTGE